MRSTFKLIQELLDLTTGLKAWRPILDRAMSESVIADDDDDVRTRDQLLSQ